MPYVNDETLSLLACSIFTLFFSSAGIALAGYGVYEVQKMPFTLKPGCHDTNCTVNVIDGKCFARFLEFSDDGSEFKKVTCDKNRDGTYEVILPCDITKHGNPKINCNKANTGPRAGFGILITALVLLGICFFMGVGCCCIGIGVAIESIWKERRKIAENKEKQEDMERRIKSQNDNRHVKQLSHIQRTEKQEEKSQYESNEGKSIPNPDIPVNPDIAVSQVYDDLHGNVYSGGFDQTPHTIHDTLNYTINHTFHVTAHEITSTFDHAGFND